jgi:hypothetical protein
MVRCWASVVFLLVGVCSARPTELPGEDDVKGMTREAVGVWLLRCAEFPAFVATFHEKRVDGLALLRYSSLPPEQLKTIGVYGRRDQSLIVEKVSQLLRDSVTAVHRRPPSVHIDQATSTSVLVRISAEHPGQFASYVLQYCRRPSEDRTDKRHG